MTNSKRHQAIYVIALKYYFLDICNDKYEPSNPLDPTKYSDPQVPASTHANKQSTNSPELYQSLQVSYLGVVCEHRGTWRIRREAFDSLHILFQEPRSTLPTNTKKRDACIVGLRIQGAGKSKAYIMLRRVLARKREENALHH